MKRLIYIALAGLIWSPNALAMTVEGHVIDNRHDDTYYSFEIQTQDERKFRFIYSEDEPSELCDLIGSSASGFSTASNLKLDQTIKVTTPDSNLKKLPDGSFTYYLCAKGAFLTLLP